MVQDIIRYFIILFTISILMGTIHGVINISSISATETTGTQLAEEVKANFNAQADSEANMPENFQTQTSAYSEQGVGLGTMIKLLGLGFIPIFTSPENGNETQLEVVGYYILGIIQTTIYLMTGALGFLIFISKKT